nr:glycosyltransferase family 2 protein [Prolixibacteraceae bacterium]
MSSVLFYQITKNEIIPVPVKNGAPGSSQNLRDVAAQAKENWILLKVSTGDVRIEKEIIFRWVQFARDHQFAWCYAHYRETKNGVCSAISTLRYQKGSIRDDFNFGPIVLVEQDLLNEYLKNNSPAYQFAGFYDFRLFAARAGKIGQFPEFVCTREEMDHRLPGEKQFDYVDPQNRSRQIEMEQAATHHLEQIGAKVSPPFLHLEFENAFPIEASVIIPVRNREKTIADALHSALGQKTRFAYNVIVINNHSTDQTGTIIDRLADERIIHHIPKATHLGIGGCWNEGINHAGCGRFAVQLDSDDLYSNENTLQKIIDVFHKECCAMVVGTYQMVNFDLQEIPPGIIDHREWTSENGPNNALRINGLGAPRAFYTPLIRSIGFPDVSYGEDYA